MKNRHFVLLVVSLTVVSCYIEVATAPNRPPNAFVVRAKTQNNNVVLSWNKAIDPDGDAVKYDIVYKSDTIARNINDTTFTLTNLPYSIEVAGFVIAKDSKGAMTSSPYNTSISENPFVLVPDINFERELIRLKIDDVQDGKLLKVSAKKIAYLYLDNLGIKNLEGIEAFIDLDRLFVTYNGLSKLDLSNNKSLTGLFAYGNQLKEIDLGKNTLLQDLGIAENNISVIDISKNLDLTNLWASENGLTTLIIGKNNSLKQISIPKNKVEFLDISQAPNLSILSAYKNSLKNLDASNNIGLIHLDVGINQLSQLDVTKNTKLKDLFISSNNFTKIDVSKNINLEGLLVNENNISELNLCNNTKIIYLWCQTNQIQTILLKDVSQVKSHWLKDASTVYKKCSD